MPNFSNSERTLLHLFEAGERFLFNQNYYEVIFSGKPTSSDGEPKTDIFVRCRNIGNGQPIDLKISYKQGNADFLENKISAERAAQILGAQWSDIITKAVQQLSETFSSKKLVYKTKYRRTEAGSITLGWKFEFLTGGRCGDLSGVLPLSKQQKQDIYAGNNLSDSKKNATVNSRTIENSGVADYLFIDSNDEVITTIQDAVDRLISIKRYVTDGTQICFACKALNCRTLHDPIKWDGDRPLAVYVNWCVEGGILTPRLVLDEPLQHKGNEIGNQLLTAMRQLNITTTDQITESNCKGDVIHQ